MSARPRHDAVVLIDHDQLDGVTRRAGPDHLRRQPVDLADHRSAAPPMVNQVDAKSLPATSEARHYVRVPSFVSPPNDQACERPPDKPHNAGHNQPQHEVRTPLRVILGVPAGPLPRLNY